MRFTQQQQQQSHQQQFQQPPKPMYAQQVKNQQGQFNRIRPASARPPVYNGFVAQNAIGDSNNESSMVHGGQMFPSAGGGASVSQRQLGSGMQEDEVDWHCMTHNLIQRQRNLSGHRSYENNIQSINRTAQQINKINQQVNTSGMDIYSGEIQKHMPRVITLDKEKLYADNLQQKNRANILIEENMKLKTKLFQAEKEISKQKRMLEATLSGTVATSKAGQFAPKMDGNSHITENLKNVIKDIRGQLAARDDECSKIKKTLKYTRIQELEIERKSFSEECQRLKGLLHEALSEKMEVLIKETNYQKLEERFLVVTREAEQLRYENTDMAHQLKDFSTQITYLTSEKKSNQKVTGLKSTLREREKEIQDLKNQLQRVRSAMNSQKPTAAGGGGVTQPLPISSSSSSTAVATTGGIKKQMRPSSAKVPGGYTNQSTTENGFLKKQIDMKDDRIRVQDEEIAQLKKQLSTTATGSNLYRQGDLHPIEEADEGKRHDNEENEGQMDTAVQQELLRIGEEVQYKLRAHGMSLQEASELLFESLEGSTTLTNLHSMLLEPPFYLQEADSVMLAQYLIEEAKNEELQSPESQPPAPEDQQLDWNSAGKNDLILEILNELVGSFNVFSKQYAQQLYDQLLEVFVANMDSIEQELVNRSNGEQSIAKDEFIRCFEELGIGLQPDQVSFLIMAMILKSPSINELNFWNLLQLFTHHEDNMQEGIHEEDEEREQDDDDDINDRVDQQFQLSQLSQQQQQYQQEKQGDQEGTAEEIEEIQEDDEYALEQFQDSQVQHSQSHPSTSGARLQRPQSSKRRAPQANNNIGGVGAAAAAEEEEDVYEQIIDEDDEEQAVRPPAGKSTKANKQNQKNKPSAENYDQEDFEDFN